MHFPTVILVFFITKCWGQEDFPCSLPKGFKGQCVKPTNCKYVRKLLSENPFSRSVMDHFSSLRCDGNRICCPIDTASRPGKTEVTPLADTFITFNISEVKSELLPISCGFRKDECIHPWTVSLKYSKESDLNCKGTVINNKYLLTAANCIPKTTENYKLIGGLLKNFQNETDCLKNLCPPEEIQMEFEESIVHENYMADKNLNDIALLRLKQSLNFSDVLQPVCLPTTAEELTSDFEGSLNERVNFGTENCSSSASKQMLKVLSLDKCISSYGGRSTITRNQICLEYTEAKITNNLWTGENIILPNKNGQSMALGFFSFQHKPRPLIFVKISKYMDWITNKLRP